MKALGTILVCYVMILSMRSRFVGLKSLIRTYSTYSNFNLKSPIIATFRSHRHVPRATAPVSVDGRTEFLRG